MKYPRKNNGNPYPTNLLSPPRQHLASRNAAGAWFPGDGARLECEHGPCMSRIKRVLSSPHPQQMMWSRSLLHGCEEAVGDTSNDTSVTMTGFRGTMHPSVLKGRELGGLLRLQTESLVQPHGAPVQTSGRLDCAAARLRPSRARRSEARSYSTLMGTAVLLTAPRVSLTLHGPCLPKWPLPLEKQF